MWSGSDGRRTNIVDTSGIRRRLAVGLGHPRSEQAMVGSASPTIERITWMRVMGDLEKAGGSLNVPRDDRDGGERWVTCRYLELRHA